MNSHAYNDCRKEITRSTPFHSSVNLAYLFVASEKRQGYLFFTGGYMCNQLFCQKKTQELFQTIYLTGLKPITSCTPSMEKRLTIFMVAYTLGCMSLEAKLFTLHHTFQE